MKLHRPEVHWGRATTAWLLLVPLMMANGALREAVFAPRVGDAAANRFSVLTGSLLIATVACFTSRWIGVRGVGPGLRVGILWLVLTLLVEFGVFGLLLGVPWHRLLDEYALWDGRLWLLVLTTCVAAPTVAGSLIRRQRLPR